MTSNPKTIEDLREHLFDAIKGVKEGTLSLDKAKMVAEISQVLVNTAKVEVDHLRAIGGAGESSFIKPTEVEPLPPGITGIRQHRLR